MTTLKSLIQAQRHGHALAGRFYNDEAIFREDLARFVFQHWFCVGHLSQLPTRGDYRTVDIGQESLLLIRGDGEQVNGMLNVCRHRGSRLCASGFGHATGGRLVCPYHAWSYDLDGRLLAASQMAKNFRREDHGLRVLPVEVVEGLIFTTLSASPPAFDDARTVLQDCAGTYGWGRAKVAHREMYTIHANWKLAIENYMECYHCQPAHPSFTRSHLYARPAEMTAEADQAARLRSSALGIRIEDLDGYATEARPGQESVSILRSAMAEGMRTASKDGAPVAPLMGTFRDYDGNSTYFDIGPLSDFLAYPDHGMVYRFIPRSVHLTEMEVLWLVDAQAVEGRDYQIDRLTWLWSVTSAEDKKIIEWNQAGIRSDFFVPGPYSAQERYAQRFTEWYLKALGA
jgi:Rieske 2Fe-2S family protein